MSKSDLGNFAELARIQGVRVTQDSLPGQLAWKLNLFRNSKNISILNLSR